MKSLKTKASEIGRGIPLILFFISILLIPFLVIQTSSADEETPEFLCLVENIYFESKGESLRGKIAVGLVTLNRLKNPAFPKTICEVVKQGPVRESWKTRSDPSLSADQRQYVPIRHRCQFSWWCDGYKERVKYDENWIDSVRAARAAMTGKYNYLVEGATHYHAIYVTPEWANHYRFIVQIDNHRFYENPKIYRVSTIQ
jgi:spore germination cell wall hydrolase CwlJ-like protein